MENKFIEQLEKMDACGEAIDWIEEQYIDSVEEFWKVSNRGEWMLWLVEHEYPGIRIDIRIMQELALEFAIMSMPYSGINKQVCIDCIYATYQYLDGWIGIDELKKYRNVAYASYATSAYAAYVAYSAAYVADEVSSVVVNRQRVYKLQADLIRQYVPTLEIE